MKEQINEQFMDKEMFIERRILYLKLEEWSGLCQIKNAKRKDYLFKGYKQRYWIIKEY